MRVTGDLFAERNDGDKPPGEVFFVINPDVDGAVATRAVERGLSIGHGLTGKPFTPERLHVTLLSIGHYPELRKEFVDTACVAAAAAAVRPFEVVFDRAISFPTGRPTRPLALIGGDGVIGVEMLQQRLFAEMKRVGLRVRKLGQRPHMTLLYDRCSVAEQPVEPVRWTVREFVLVHSLYGQSRHVPLARWPLLAQS